MHSLSEVLLSFGVALVPMLPGDGTCEGTVSMNQDGSGLLAAAWAYEALPRARAPYGCRQCLAPVCTYPPPARGHP